MAEEQKNWEEANNHTLCVNNCGFFGSPTTLNLCSKCYQHHCLKEQHISTAKFAVEKSLSESHLQSQTQTQIPSSSDSDSSSSVTAPATVLASISTDSLIPNQTTRNRCGSCRRRVGLTGFTCRCGTTFCGTHRYPEQHGCTFDFKTMGKEAIAKANPVIKAAKLEKI